MATLDQVIGQMAAAGMPPVPPSFPSAIGKVVRYGPQKKAWYRIREYTTRKGVRLYSGTFGVWRGTDPGTVKVEFNRDDIDEADLADIRRRHAEAVAAEEARREERARRAANRALEQWQAGRATGESPYLKRKNVEPEKGLRFASDGTLLVPMVRYDVPEKPAPDAVPEDGPRPRRLVGLQKIAADGSKKFNAGMAKSGAACRLGKAPKDGEPILIAEGVATGLSVRQAIGRSRAVFVAFDAGNLLPVARILRTLYPTSPLVFCADDDAYLEARMNKLLRDDYGVADLLTVPATKMVLAGTKGELELLAAWDKDPDGVPTLTGAVAQSGRLYTFAMTNAGRTKAAEAAREAGNARVCWPVFANRELGLSPEAPRFTDFNDLHCTEGLDQVERQLAGWLNGLDFTPPKAAAPKDGKEPAGGPAGGGGKGAEPPTDWERFWRLVNRFTYIYPTDTAWDAELGDIVKVEHMRLMFGSRYTSMWLGSDHRQHVTLDNVVFDPGAKPSRDRVNLFTGLGVEAKEGKCDRLLGLLHFLCNEDDGVFDWVLKWLAYPLQHLGAKMRTAVVMWGKEGTGKNLFFEVVRAIYGKHGGMITQKQLEADFQTWLSAKLFLIANEVISRQEMRHHVGYLKNLITEPEIWINRKNRDERCEANHCNLVFFSNELQPLQISPDDRRYMIIRTPPLMPAEFYRAVVDEIAAGGAAALLAYLQAYDLGGFDPHSKPIETDAKRELIQLGMSSPQLFWQEVKSGDLELPYCPALSTDVYRCFVAYCKRTGEKQPAKMNRFIPDFMSMNGIRRHRTRVPALKWEGDVLTTSGAKMRNQQVLLMGEPPAGVEFDEWVRASVVAFAEKAEAYCRERQ